jgi:hypothetical protein
MDPNPATAILRKHADGIDPATGGQLPLPTGDEKGTETKRAGVFSGCNIENPRPLPQQDRQRDTRELQVCRNRLISVSQGTSYRISAAGRVSASAAFRT